MRRALLLLSTLLLPACGESTPDPGISGDSASGIRSSTVAADDTFDLNMGARVKAGDGLELALTGVLEDSRCPEGAQCIQAGRARLSLEVGDSSGLTRVIILATTPDSATRDTAFGRVVRLITLAPAPAIGVPVVQGDYTARLVLGPGGP